MKRIQFLQIIKLAPIEYLIRSTGITGKGQMSGDIWLNKKDGTKNKNPKVEITWPRGSARAKKRNFS